MEILIVPLSEVQLSQKEIDLFLSGEDHSFHGGQEVGQCLTCV